MLCINRTASIVRLVPPRGVALVHVELRICVVPPKTRVYSLQFTADSNLTFDC